MTGRDVHRGESIPLVPVVVGTLVVLLGVLGAGYYRYYSR